MTSGFIKMVAPTGTGTGAQGPQGESGAGVLGRLSWVLSTASDNFDVYPQQGTFKYRQAGTTQLALSTVSSGSIDVGDWITSLRNLTRSESLTVTIVKVGDPGTYRSGPLSAITVKYPSGGAFAAIATMAHDDVSGTFSDGDVCTVAFSVRGDRGPVGTQGLQGYQGNPGGPQGYQGHQGPQGIQGAQGAKGSQGAQGSIGAQGPQGAQGAYGGPQGHPGTEGVQGHQGNQGSSRGPQGAGGEAGHAGLTGPTGAQGYTGESGYQGVQGVIGSPQGYQGYVGDRGPQGHQGEYGGPQGTQGVQGEKGVQGFQGPEGSSGHQGNQGHQGHQGTQGGTGLIGVDGPQGLVGSTGTQGDPGTQGTTGVKGAQGDSGHNGPQGPQGVQGTQGSSTGFQGSRGSQGVQGPQGASGGGGSAAVRPALDANHIHVFNCDDASGVASLVDSGSGNRSAILYGTAGTDYTIGTSYVAGRSTSSLRSLKKGNASIDYIAATPATCNISGTQITVECVLKFHDPLSTYAGQYFFDVKGASDIFRLQTNPDTGAFQFSVYGGGTWYWTGMPTLYDHVVHLGRLMHVMCVYDTSQSNGYRLKIYVNGRLVSYDGENPYGNATYVGSLIYAGVTPTASLSLNQVIIGGTTAAGYVPQCNIRDVRISNTARSAAYARTTADALLSL